MTIHVHARRTALTLVTSSGITFTPCDCGVLIGGVAPLGRRIVQRLLKGLLMVTTPHRAGGAYRERGAGGVYDSINPKARLLTLLDQCQVDNRVTVEEGLAIFSSIEAAYSQKG